MRYWKMFRALTAKPASCTSYSGSCFSCLQLRTKILFSTDVKPLDVKPLVKRGVPTQLSEREFIGKTLIENKLDTVVHILPPRITSHLQVMNKNPLADSTTLAAQLEKNVLLLTAKQLQEPGNELNHAILNIALKFLEHFDSLTPTPALISILLWSLFPFEPYISAVTDKENISNKVNKLAHNQLSQLDFTGTCRLVHWNKIWSPSNNEIDPDLLSRLLYLCKTSDNLLIVCYLLYRLPISSEALRRRFVDLCGEIHMKRSYAVTGAEKRLAVTCSTLFRHPGGNILIYRRDFLSWLWEAIAHYGYQGSKDKMPVAMQLCLKQACASTAELSLILTKYYYMPSKIFSCIDKLLPQALAANDSYTLCRILLSMVTSRHVNTETMKTIANHIKATPLHTLRFKEIAVAVKNLADYGYNDTDLYKVLLEECLSDRRLADQLTSPERLFSCLSGFSHLQIYPVKLYERLFSGQKANKWLNRTVENKESTVEMLTLLIESFKLHHPDRAATLFPGESTRIPDAESMLNEKSVKLNHRQMQAGKALDLTRAIYDLVDRGSNSKFVVRKKRVIEFMTYEDLVIQHRYSTNSWVVVITDHRDFISLYSRSGSGVKGKQYSVIGYRQRGILRCHVQLLRMLGHNVVEMNYYDYCSCSDMKVYARQKLTEAGVL